MNLDALIAVRKIGPKALAIIMAELSIQLLLDLFQKLKLQRKLTDAS